MTRLLLVPLTGVIMTLAVLLQNIWLYAAGGIALFLLLALLIGYGWRRWRGNGGRSIPSAYEEAPSQPSLEDLGITEIRPKNKQAPAPAEEGSRDEMEEHAPADRETNSGSSTVRASDAPDENRDSAGSGDGRRAADSEGRADTSPASEVTASASTSTAVASVPDTESEKEPERDVETETEADADAKPDSSPASSPAPDPESQTIAEEERIRTNASERLYTHTRSRPLGLDASDLLEPHLRTLQASVHAHTACLIGMQGQSEGYRLEAFVSRSPHVAAERVIEADEHFLRTVSPEEPVTILVAEGESPSFDELGYYDRDEPVELVAVSPVRTEEGVVAYLLVDRIDASTPVPAAHYRVLARSADLLGQMIDARAEERPRREIIEEEMAEARAQERPLALALVHPEDAETIGERGPQAIQEAEHRLERILSENTPHGRIERFGELIFGVFYYDEEDAVEDWAEQVQGSLSEADWGGHMGVAILSDRHEGPEDLRGDATEALRVAYEAGENECVIFE